MNRKIVTALLTGLFAASLAQAGNIGGYWTQWRTKDAGDNDGLGFKLTLTEKGTASALELRVARFSDLSAETDPNTLKVTPVELGSRFLLSQDGPLEVYMGLGVGYYLMDYGTLSVGDEFGFYGLLGGEFKFGESFILFAEATYRRVRAKPLGLEPMKLDGIGINAGIGYVW